MGHKIALVIFDKFTDLDLFLPWDILNRVKSVGKVTDWEVKIVGTEASHVSDAGLQIPTMGLIDEVKDADAVLFTSGVMVPSLIQDSEYIKRLKLSPDRQLIGSMCSGALFLAELGLLTGKEATTYPTRKELLSSYGVEVVDKAFVHNKNIATAAGCLAAQQLSEWVIQSLVGEAVAKKVINSILPIDQMETAAR